jgi:hypothetical protein
MPRQVIKPHKGNRRHKPRKQRLERLRRADHKFAVATIALMVFLLVAGLTAWVLDEKPSIAAADSPTTGSDIR